MTISALDRKLLRDLVGMKGQAIAIGMVLASGIAMYVTYLSNFDSLQRTRAVYYDRFRFADVFASCKRAPLRLEERLREIPGVSAVDTRTVVEVTLDVPDAREPLKGRLIGIPGRGSAEARRPLSPSRTLDRARARRRGAAERALRPQARSAARLAPRSADQRTAADADGGRPRPLARVRLRAAPR